jgi:hypothetical protein
MVFDAYGTLFDVRVVVLQEALRIDADLAALARLWPAEAAWTYLAAFAYGPLRGFLERDAVGTSSFLPAASRRTQRAPARSPTDVLPVGTAIFWGDFGAGEVEAFPIGDFVERITGHVGRSGAQQRAGELWDCREGAASRKYFSVFVTFQGPAAKIAIEV